MELAKTLMEFDRILQEFIKILQEFIKILQKFIKFLSKSCQNPSKDSSVVKIIIFLTFFYSNPPIINVAFLKELKDLGNKGIEVDDLAAIFEAVIRLENEKQKK